MAEFQSNNDGNELKRIDHLHSLENSFNSRFSKKNPHPIKGLDTITNKSSSFPSPPSSPPSPSSLSSDEVVLDTSSSSDLQTAFPSSSSLDRLCESCEEIPYANPKLSNIILHGSKQHIQSVASDLEDSCDGLVSMKEVKLDVSVLDEQSSLKRIYYLAACFCIMFIGYNTAQIQMTNIFPKTGFIALCIFYGCFAISSWFSGAVVRIAGEKPTIVASALITAAYLGCSMPGVVWLFLMFSAFAGLATGPLWVAQGSYMGKTVAHFPDSVGKFQASFLCIFNLNGIVGNLTVAIISTVQLASSNGKPIVEGTGNKINLIILGILTLMIIISSIMFFFMKNPPKLIRDPIFDQEEEEKETNENEVEMSATRNSMTESDEKIKNINDMPEAFENDFENNVENGLEEVSINSSCTENDIPISNEQSTSPTIDDDQSDPLSSKVSKLEKIKEILIETKLTMIQIFWIAFDKKMMFLSGYLFYNGFAPAFMWGGVAPMYKQVLPNSGIYLPWIILSYAVALLPSAFVSGKVWDKWGWKPLVAAHAILVALSMAMFPIGYYLAHPAPFFIAAFLMGITENVVNTIASASTLKYFSDRPAIAFSMFRFICAGGTLSCFVTIYISGPKKFYLTEISIVVSCIFAIVTYIIGRTILHNREQKKEESEKTNDV